MQMAKLGQNPGVTHEKPYVKIRSQKSSTKHTKTHKEKNSCCKFSGDDPNIERKMQITNP